MTKSLNDEKALEGITNKFFMRLNYLNENWYEVESVSSAAEDKEPNFIGFFILQYAKLRLPELYYNIFYKICDFSSFQRLKMDTESLNLVLAHIYLQDFVKAEMKETWNSSEKKNAETNFHLFQSLNSSLEPVARETSNTLH